MASLADKFDVIVPEHPGFGDIRHARLARYHPRPRLFLSRLPRPARSRSRPSRRRLARRLDRGGARGARHAPARLAHACRRRRHPCDGVAQIDPFLRTDEQRIRDFFHDQERADEMVARLLQARARRHRDEEPGRDREARPGSRAATIPHLHKWLHRIDVPTLLIWGANDRLFPKDYAFALQRLIPGSKAVDHPRVRTRAACREAGGLRLRARKASSTA